MGENGKDIFRKGKKFWEEENGKVNVERGEWEGECRKGRMGGEDLEGESGREDNEKENMGRTLFLCLFFQL